MSKWPSSKLQVRRNALILTCLGIFSRQWAYAATVHPPVVSPFGDVVPAATMTKKPATSLIAGSLVVTLNRTTLAEVLRHFPGGRISLDREPGASSTYSLCYAIHSVKPTEYIWFISDGEMGGNAHHITEIQATRRVLSRAERSRCGDVTKRLKFAFNNGTWIGSSVRQVDRVLGAPSAKKGHWYGYSYEGKEQCKMHGGLVSFDVGNFFQARIENGTVMDIDASEVISD